MGREEDSQHEHGFPVDDRIVEAITRRVSQLLRQDSGPSETQLVSAAEVARRFGVSRHWVYENAARLGALRLGDGAHPRLRFDVRQVEQRLRSESHEGTIAPGKSRAASWVAPTDLIPIRRK